MTQNTGENIKNMIICEKGEHCLFRSFGLSTVDSPSRITRYYLQAEVNRWFPGEIIESVQCVYAGIDGNFDYNIKIRGRS